VKLSSLGYVQIARHMYKEGYRTGYRTNIGTWINSEKNDNKTRMPQSVAYVLPHFWASDRSLICVSVRAINLAMQQAF